MGRLAFMRSKKDFMARRMDGDQAPLTSPS
jgi:hypothetical protein